MKIHTVCILGGTGFVGRHLANRLAQRGIHMRVLSRHRERHRAPLIVQPTLQLLQANAHDEQDLQAHFRGCDAVINLVGILNGSESAFQRAHVDLPRKILSACRATGVPRLLHMCALGADARAPSRYQRSKAEGERLVLEAQSEDLAVTSFRPSVIFGPEDQFLNRFAGLLKRSPGVFPLPTPKARFSPVYVGDVAEVFTRALEDRASHGRAFELCGPRSYSLRELVRYAGELSGHRRAILGLGDGLSALQGRLLQLLPGTPYSYDNYLSATVDNVCRENGLAHFGIHPSGLEAVAPGYLASLATRRRYDAFRRQARRQ
ncbi:complex I NDUFA9 subunit family protein [Alkalilimnicola sp. S0819]|uniref:complex I NDUFA9 subunit family protein n=1 Tax=Alkalilimnicola sp. S0819 TaxID=2613922 RepID=UPI00126203A0|nr:complex I NDUFA9 subunit family protein [Alkalilimnicola sp. S0819]KAB7627308.1 complex I NDUFA9 subunit family protein [Alkalilimnicola sp. S0819]MPQ16023.1 NAD-dependent epimerase/dehydratase family protein [Alkalilimnicola sp. S0819]